VPLATLAPLAAAADEISALLREPVARYACLSCHGMVRKQVGPGFAQIAARYRNDPEAPARLADKLRDGSVGAWGRVIMPRQPHMSLDESRRLAQWVLSQPSPP
jgi:cytochrome c